MARLELAVLGGFHAALDGTPVTGFDADKTRALLVYLAVEASRPHRRDALAGLFWPEFADDAARRNLRYTLFKLRQVLGDEEGTPGFLLVTPQTVGLDPAAGAQVDIAAFTEHLAAIRTHRHRSPTLCTTCYAHYSQAVALYRGPFLHGFYLPDCQAFDEWALIQRERMHRAAVEALGYLATYHETRAEFTPALEYTYRQLELEPWREEAHRQAMRLLAASGQRSAALAQYVGCRTTLADELNAEPAAETTALYEQLKSESLTAAPDLLLKPVARLPRSLTPLIGRETELRLLLQRLDSPDFPLLTIVGPGGVGKTRLALQVAQEQAGALRDGVHWVPLAAVNTSDLLVDAIAQALDLPVAPSATPATQLTQFLRDKESLLVLDNFEQLLPGGAALELLMDLLADAPRLCLLITSREPLGLETESLLHLTGLPLPAEPVAGIRPAESAGLSPDALLASSAVQLFVERAQRASAAFDLSAETAPGVVEICRLVGGLPLGIVLAAAWVRQLPPARIAASIQANLDFLTSATRDRAPHHSSLRAVFHHSWSLLTPDEQKVFRRLAVFRGGWEEEAAEGVAGATVLSLISLVDKSLLRRDANGRFEMHEVLRQYASEKLDEMPKEESIIGRRHAEYYLSLARLAEPGLRSDKQVMWLERLELEHDNLRVALRWAEENAEQEIGLLLGVALWRFWYVRGYYSEGREHLATLLAIPTTIEQTQSTYPDLMRARAVALNGAGVLATLSGDQQVARASYEESLALSRELGDKQGQAASLSNLAIFAHQEGSIDRARTLQEDSLSLRRELGDKQGVAASLNNLGLMAQELGDYEGAGKLHEETLALRRELGDTLGIAASLGNLGVVAQELGDYSRARSLYEESLAARKELGDKAGMAELLGHLGTLAHKAGDYKAAHDLYEQGLLLSNEMGYRWGVALLLNNLGLVAQALGDFDGAIIFHKESLAIRTDLGERAGIIQSLVCLAATIAQRGGAVLEQNEESPHPAADARQLEQAAMLFGAVSRLLESTPLLSADDRQLYEQSMRSARSLLTAASFEQAWAKGQVLSLEQVRSIV